MHTFFNNDNININLNIIDDNLNFLQNRLLNNEGLLSKLKIANEYTRTKYRFQYIGFVDSLTNNDNMSFIQNEFMMIELCTFIDYDDKYKMFE